MLRLDHLEFGPPGFAMTADLSVAGGARVAVIGPSGAGKSTLLAAIAGFVPVTSGRILWQGDDITDLAPARRPVSLLFQDNNLFPHLSVAQNLGLGIRPDLRLTAEDRDRVGRALADTGLDGLGERRPAQLSGGQQSRAALARALLRDRPVLMLDEPFAALGPALKTEMLDLVARICDRTGATLLMVSHDPEDARRIAPDSVLVAGGKVHPPRKTADLLDNPPPVLAAYLGKENGRP